MSFASKPRKVKPKGMLKELKIVHSVSRRGVDVLKAEVMKTPRHKSQKSPSSSRINHSSSPIKRQKADDLEPFDAEPIPFHLEGHDEYKKRQTLVFIFLW